ncbi:hypothetical protein RHSIM_Rhsim03G0027800 [Rhododendron simsii]|uniref:Uncharacterized protein n=1 Tax=Rhododendron simsii TaxID=118357 RepID=A0A834LRY8_RHOSS|nr:hypothetical protein RHSIM_Rhsim03G0027800 [Rhododendron simsii]
MAAATRAIHDRLKIPLSSANEDLQPMLAGKRLVIALNKKDLANPNIMQASFIVLDMKPLKKMELPYKRDQQIVSGYSLMEKREDKAEKAASIGG